MPILLYILILFSVILIAYSFSLKKDPRVPIYVKMQTDTGFRKPNPFLAIFSPLARILLSRAKTRDALKGKLLSAKSKILPEEFIAFKLLLAVGFFFLVFMFFDKKPIWLGLATLIGFLAPDIWLNNKVKAHKAAIQRVLPETIDLLSLCIGAGLDFTGAVRWITEKAKPNPMIDEFKLVLSSIKVGMSRVDALKEMSKRLDILDVSSFVHNLVLAERMGTPVEETFAILSEDMRLRRVQYGERQALKAPIKILIPLIFCILPIILIIVAGPVLIKFMGSGLLGSIK